MELHQGGPRTEEPVRRAAGYLTPTPAADASACALSDRRTLLTGGGPPLGASKAIPAGPPIASVAVTPTDRAARPRLRVRPGKEHGGRSNEDCDSPVIGTPV